MFYRHLSFAFCIGLVSIAIASWYKKSGSRLFTSREASLPFLLLGDEQVKVLTDRINPRAWVAPDLFQEPYGKSVEGLLTFRGNATRTFHGTGDISRKPKMLWKYPEEPMCALSFHKGEMHQWCGAGWTGQPAVFERMGRTWVTFGAYDRAVHFVDADNGRDIIPPFRTGDIIKGSVTVDPDGYPIVYSGSRDGFYRAIAFDGRKPRELWKLSAEAVGPAVWNDDWDGSGLVLRDHLFIGGENSRVHVVKLNRDFRDGWVDLNPEIVSHGAGWNERLFSLVGDRNVSIENSVSIFQNTLFFANSGGLVQGWDIQDLATGGDFKRTFSYWAGDDVDASIVIDALGALYVGVERERFNKRSRSVGQLLKLDPKRKNPLVWSVKIGGEGIDGIWATPALYKHLVIAPTHGGSLLGVHRRSGTIEWKLKIGGKGWSSPVIVGDTLLQGDCDGNLKAHDLRQSPPRELWSVKLPGCIEATPAVWRGRIYVGVRDGYVYAFDTNAGPSPRTSALNR